MTNAILSASQADQICRRLIPLAEKSYDLIKQLAASGFSSFFPANRFTESFAGNEDELSLHRQLIMASVKQVVATPEPWTKVDETSIFYKNKFPSESMDLIICLNNGVNFDEIKKVYPGDPWRLNYSPCQRRKEEMKRFQPERFSVVDNQWRKELGELRKFEISRHATGLSKAFGELGDEGPFEKGKRLIENRYNFYIAVMTRDAVKLGFSFNNQQSMRFYPIFSKAINQHWMISWAIERDGDMRLGTRRGRLHLDLELRSTGIKKKRVDVLGGALPNGQVLRLRHDALVRGFEWHYGLWHSLDELEMMIRAHLKLYELISEDIERAVRQVVDAHPF